MQCETDQLDRKTVDDDEKLKILMAKACATAKGSPQRQKYLTQVIEIILNSEGLFRNYSPCYPDALQEALFRLCRNPEVYAPNKGDVITWFNSNLRYRLRDAEKERREPPRVLYRADHYYELLENLPAKPQKRSMIEITLNWIKTDPQNLLRTTHLRNRPDVNAQLMLLERFAKETAYDVLVARLQVPCSTLAMFYRRKCKPPLVQFWEDEGFL